jgi:hypothetical protein
MNLISHGNQEVGPGSGVSLPCTTTLSRRISGPAMTSHRKFVFSCGYFYGALSETFFGLKASR